MIISLRPASSPLVEFLIDQIDINKTMGPNGFPNFFLITKNNTYPFLEPISLLNGTKAEAEENYINPPAMHNSRENFQECYILHLWKEVLIGRILQRENPTLAVNYHPIPFFPLLLQFLEKYVNTAVAEAMSYITYRDGVLPEPRFLDSFNL